MIKKKISTLRIKDLSNLAKHLGTSPRELSTICDVISASPERYYFQWEKRFPNGKTRPMVKVFGRLREILDRMTHLLQHVELPPYIHGGVPGSSPRSNAKPHLNKPMVLCTDLQKHFPSVSPKQVYEMFCRQQQCAPDVARVLTRLTTLNGALPQGSPTSIAVSNLVTLNLSKRLHRFAKVRGADCTQYVDDYAFSGEIKLARYENKIAQIVTQEGFTTNPDKTELTSANKEQVVTGVRVNGQHPDVPSVKIKKVRKRIAELEKRLESGQGIADRDLRSLEGKIGWIRWFNRGTAKFLQCRLHRIKSTP